MSSTTQRSERTINIKAALDDLRTKYISSNPKAEASFQRACKVLPGGNTRSVLFFEPFPITLVSGRDCYVTSLDGKEYLDLVSEFSAALLGHSNPEIRSAILEAAQSGLNLGGHNTKEIELAESITARFKSVDMVRFTNSGSEANTFALGVAMNFTKRSQILVFENGYHGGTLTFSGPRNPLNLPHDYVFGRYNDIEGTRSVLSRNIAAILVEPMLGAGGALPATREFLQFLRESATEIGAVLIFDEVITSRLHIGGLQAYHDVYPDMTTLGKYLGGGFSFGAFGGRREIMERLDPRLSPADGGISHSGTYNNNIFSMSAGVAAAKLLTAEGIERCNGLGDLLRKGIQQMVDKHGIDFIHIRGMGSMIGIGFSGSCGSILRDAFFFHMLDQGIYMGRRGFMCLNLAHEEGHVKRILEAVQQFVESFL